MKCSIITYNQLNTCLSRERHFFPLPITLFLFQKLERRKCSVRDTSIERIRMVNNRIIVQRSTRSFSLSFFFQTNFKNAKRKRKSMESIERSHYCSTIDAYFSPFFFFFLNLIFISITWHWYQKKKKKKRVGNAWHSRYGILIFVIIRSNGANSVLWPIFPGGVVAKLLCYSYTKLTYAARQK